ncbi:hypothetical protein O166_23340 [Pseudogulbenkiania ferrooxidans EGD-HP2]|uniref:Uncharacterized protein n=1 Tax=Pseudogulbenkiania ferrooxidans EGD-HP2 TaxID=1388764 RepID=A0ABP2XS33_9NEIS|nr:hypothetical protein O166_23340 [Pseudogulbenkiania ferrooxidans EGD-HP2]
MRLKHPSLLFLFFIIGTNAFELSVFGLQFLICRLQQSNVLRQLL